MQDNGGWYQLIVTRNFCITRMHSKFVLTGLYLNKTTGTPRLCLSSPAMFYSVCLVLLLLGSLYCSLGDRISAIDDRGNFDDKIYNVLHIIMCSCCVAFPVVMAFDTKKFVHYTNEWMEFQVSHICKN
jgi:hypothetical protein